MDSEVIKSLSDFISSVGIPGGMLFFIAWSGVKVLPSLVKFLEGITVSLAEIKVVLGDMKDEMREMNGRATP